MKRTTHLLVLALVSATAFLSGAPEANAAPCSGPDYSGSGMPTARNTYYRPQYSDAWNLRLAASDSAWNSISEVHYTRTSFTNNGAGNTMYVGNYTWGEYGWYYPKISGGTQTFSIAINSRTIANDYNAGCGLADCWGNFVKSVTNHELGHGLNLGHNPAGGKWPGYYLSVMATGRNRNTLFAPQSLDRQNVSQCY